MEKRHIEYAFAFLICFCSSVESQPWPDYIGLNPWSALKVGKNNCDVVRIEIGSKAPTDIVQCTTHLSFRGHVGWIFLDGNGNPFRCNLEVHDPLFVVSTLYGGYAGSWIQEFGFRSPIFLSVDPKKYIYPRFRAFGKIEIPNDIRLIGKEILAQTVAWYPYAFLSVPLAVSAPIKMKIEG